ncbi:MAG: exporters of the superfamily protein [Myxococcales bacterium]|nr:exporters of the superfamily protein [Myxococcales bacterium]
MAHRYALWIELNRWSIVVASIAFTIIAAVTAMRITVLADFSYLLPQSVRSVQDLRAIEKRARVIGTAMVVVESDHPEHRKQAAELMRQRVIALGPTRVASVTFDRRVEHQYAWDHRWLFAELADLKAARDALASEIDRAKLEANPLYIPLDEAPARNDSADKLKAKLHDAELARDEAAEMVSKDGRVQIMILHTAFSTGDVDRDRELVERLKELGAGITQAMPDVSVGVAGDAAVSLAEHDAILNGMLRATAVTVVLVLLAMGWFFRSTLAIGALSWSLLVGTVATFAFTKLTLGYLNVATAFLSSIVIGNGINVGIIVTARYLEELRAGRDGCQALANTIEKTIAGTFAAALTASVAYASLVITVFRGFRHFGIIGGVGIMLCWISAYVVLPAALSVARRLKMQPRSESPLGRWLAMLLPARLRVVAFVIIGFTVFAGGITLRYLGGDPFENNFRNLRSHSDDISEAQHWMTKIDQAFGQGVDGGFVIAVAHREQVAPLQKQLKDRDRGKPEGERLFANVVSINDLLPSDQPNKLSVLAEIRALLSGKDIDALADADRAEALRLRPPDDLKALSDNDIPEAIAWPFIEADGTRGKLLLATAGKGYEIWDAHDTVRFSDNVRALELPEGAHLGGASFVFADVLDAVLTDGPRATLAAAAGAILIVLLVLGFNRFGFVTLVCGASGTLMMIGASAILGFKINFLDFVALPITIGIGIEYAVNIVARSRQEGEGHGAAVLASTGGAVFLCSYTTIVGYGSLLLSQNLGIRSFGLAAMLGEVTCLIVALLLAPALLTLLMPRAKR